VLSRIFSLVNVKKGLPKLVEIFKETVVVPSTLRWTFGRPFIFPEEGVEPESFTEHLKVSLMLKV
jgi:hypothetical protein